MGYIVTRAPLLAVGQFIHTMAKDTFYFSHDFNARNDDKIKMLLRKHKWSGYGLFWAIVEDLYNNANALRLDYEGIAYELRTDEETIKSIINDFGLFEIENNMFGSASIERRIDERNAKSQSARESAYHRWNKVANNANASEINANASKNDAISKGSKVINKRKEVDEAKSATFPVLECRENYIKTNQPAIFELKKKYRIVDDAIFLDILNNFNSHLITQGKKEKEHDDYAKHFANWIKKIDVTEFINKPIKQKQPSLDKYI